MKQQEKNEILNIEQMLNLILSYAIEVGKTEVIPIEKALNCIIAQDQKSTIDIPTYDSSAMDGYAFNIDDFNKKTLLIKQQIAAGDNPDKLIKFSACRIFTGAIVPEGANTIVMQEYCQVSNNELKISITPEIFSFINKKGSVIKKGCIVYNKGHIIKAQDLALLASLGKDEIKIIKPLKVGILSTGNELILPGEKLQRGKIYNSNRYLLLGLLDTMNVEVTNLLTISDTIDCTIKSLKNMAKEVDLIITTGGVSVGDKDYIKPAIENLGKLLSWKVKMKPGKPLVFGKIYDTPILGLPGNPVSSFVVFNLFIRPFIEKMSGCQLNKIYKEKIIADFDFKKNHTKREYLRAKKIQTDDGVRVIIFSNQSSSALNSVVWANGLACIYENKIVKKGDEIDFIPFSQWRL